jgi:hypothetical protein
MINVGVLFGKATPDLVTKYVFSRNGANVSTGLDTRSAYDIAYTDVSSIESNQGVGAPGILNTVLTYTRTSIYLSETVHLDLTDSTTFWNDVKNWLYMNNFYGIVYDSGLDKYVINDVTNKSYLHILYV